MGIFAPNDLVVSSKTVVSWKTCTRSQGSKLTGCLSNEMLQRMWCFLLNVYISAGFCRGVFISAEENHSFFLHFQSNNSPFSVQDPEPPIPPTEKTSSEKIEITLDLDLPSKWISFLLSDIQKSLVPCCFFPVLYSLLLQILLIIYIP